MIRTKNRKPDNGGFSITWVVTLMTIVLLLLAGLTTMVTSSFRSNNDRWYEEQAYLCAKSSVDLIAHQFTSQSQEAEELYEFYVLDNCNKFEIHDFDANTTIKFKTEVQMALISQNQMAILAVSQNERARKGVVVYLESDRVIEEIDYLEKEITYTGDNAPAFKIVGYKVVDNIYGNEINIDEVVVVGKQEDITDPDKEDDVEGKVKVSYFIRYDGKIPYEPSKYGTNLYTKGITIKNAVKEAIPIANDFEKLSQNMSRRPTTTQIKKVYPTYDSRYQYILWYVQKYDPSDGWHIDGVMLNKSQYNVIYAPNFDGWDMNVNGSVPSGGQCPAGTMYDIETEQSLSLRRTDYQLAGWIRSDTSEVIPITGSFLMPTSNVTLYAKWIPSYKLVQFMKNDGTTSVYSKQEITFNGLVTKPKDPIRLEYYTLPNGKMGQYYSFDGWYTSAKGTEKWDFAGRRPDRHMNLYAHWKINDPNIKIVDFMLNSGDFTSIFKRNYTVVGGTTISPGEPKRLGYVFNGWFTSPDGNEGFSFDTKIYDERKVYAHWTEALKVRYASDGLSCGIPNGYFLEDEDAIVSNVVPKRAGKYFHGWESETGDVYFGSDTFKMPDHSVTLNAIWKDDPSIYIVEYDSNYPSDAVSTSGNLGHTVMEGINKVVIADNAFDCSKKAIHEYKYDSISEFDPYNVAGSEGYLFADTFTSPKIGITVTISEGSEGLQRITPSHRIITDADGKPVRLEIKLELSKPKDNGASTKGDVYRYPIVVVQNAVNTIISRPEIAAITGVESMRIFVGEEDREDEEVGSDYIVATTRQGKHYNDVYINFKDLNAGNPDKNSKYNFVGWNTKPDGTGTKFQPGDIWESESHTGATLKLYAQWIVA